VRDVERGRGAGDVVRKNVRRVSDRRVSRMEDVAHVSRRRMASRISEVADELASTTVASAI